MTYEEETKAMQPYLLAVGTVVYEWNGMIEGFGMLFGSILNPGDEKPPAAWAVYHSTTSDRAQIDMLKAAAIAEFDGNDSTAMKTKEDIEWLCNQATARIDDRNNIVHAPLIVSTIGDKPLEIVPFDFFGHTRAKRLSSKDLINECEWLASYAKTLRTYAIRMFFSIHHGRTVHSWPSRPALPNRGQKSKTPPHQSPDE